MALPEVTLEAIKQAMDQFDQEFRETDHWLKWEQDETYKYAIKRDEKYYPVKKIVSLATGVPVDQFSGGNEANSCVERGGLTVIKLRSEPTGEVLRWRRTGPDSHDLVLENPEVADREKLKSLYEGFMSAPFAAQPEYNEQLRIDLKQWITDPGKPLTSEMYVTLSNWFLSQPAFRNSARGVAAGSLWDFLFVCRPPDRLSSPGPNNHIIIPKEFDRWWPEQEKLQGNVIVAELDPENDHVTNATQVPSSAMNLILYGPPGTGKTYQSIERAVKFIDPGVATENHMTMKQKYDDLVHRGRIEFITFHQSYSYEDFVEGIRPVMDPGEEGNVPRYECRPGVFKRLAVSALFDCLKGTRMPKELSEKEKSQIVHQFLHEGETSGYQLKPESEWNQYVLVIDEINRGNISKIFGELITLIEPDKRLRTGGQQNTLIVTLPYSGEKFAVPTNLRLLATMNTADKSIALVDIALRRRFDFEEIGVDMNICKELTPEMLAAISELNRRIVLRKDRDHRVGHAYFVRVFDELSFNLRFRNQIIPLLQEYFYNDWEGLRYVLGENSNSDGSFVRKLSGADDREARTKWQWYFDAGGSLNCLKTLSNNYKAD